MNVLDIPFAALIAVKATIVLLAGVLLSFFFRRASASLRHAVWCATFFGLALVPLFGTVGSLGHGFAIPVAAAPEPVRVATTEAAPAATAARPAPTLALDTARRGAPVERRGLSARAWLGLLWVVPSVVLLGRLLVGFVASARLARRSVVMTDRRWADALERARARLGVKDGVELRVTDSSPLPMTVGLLRPTILLPSSASSYAEPRRVAVLLHELAHVRRRDCLTLSVSQLVSALYWWNPLVWVGAREMRLLSERASDDLVLHAGAPAADYAHDLLEMARGLGGERLSALATVSMAHRSRFEERLLAILDPRIARGAVSLRLFSGIAALAVPLVLFVALATPTRASRSAEAAKSKATAVVLSVPKAIEQDAPEPEANAEPVRVATAQPPEPERERTPAARETRPAQEDDSRARARAALAEALDDPEPNVREQALHALVQMQDPAVAPHLERALESPDPDVRAEAAWGLGMMHREESAASLAKALSDADDNVREQAAWALGMIQSEASVSALVQALRDAEANVREQTAWALGMIESSSAVEGLLGALSDEAANVREQAAWALGMIGDPRSLDALSRALKDADASVREQAAWALGMIANGGHDDPDPNPNPDPNPDFELDFRLDFDGDEEEEKNPVGKKESAPSFARGAVL